MDVPLFIICIVIGCIVRKKNYVKLFVKRITSNCIRIEVCLF